MSADARKFDGPQVSTEDERWPTVVEALAGRTIAAVAADESGNTILNFTDGSAVQLLGGLDGSVFFVVEPAETP